MQPGEHRVVHALGAGRAVLDDQAGVPLEHALEPRQVRAVVGEQPRAEAGGVEVGARARGDVVVELEVLHAQVQHQGVDHAVQVGAGLGAAQVQVEAAVLHDPVPLALEERRFGQLLRHRAAHADDLGLEPQAGRHARRADVVQHRGQAAVGESHSGRLPLADAVPPVGERVVVPARVDAEVLGARRGGRVDQRQQLGGGRIAHEGVHVVVEDDRQALGLGALGAQRAPVQGERPQGSLPAVAHGHGDGHGGERLPRRDRQAPVVLGVARAHEQERQLAGTAAQALAELGVPGAVVLDLPGPRGAGGAVLEHSSGHPLAGRPGAAAGDGERATRVLLLVGGQAHLHESALAAHGHPLPAALAEPVAVAGVQVHVVDAVAVRAERAGGEGRDGEQRERLRALVDDLGPGLDRGDALGGAQRGAHAQAGGRVDLLDDQLAPARRVVRGVAGVAQAVADRGGGVAQVGARVAVAEGEDLHERLCRDERGLGALGGACLQGGEAHRRIVIADEHSADGASSPVQDGPVHQGRAPHRRVVAAVRRAPMKALIRNVGKPVPSQPDNAFMTIGSQPRMDLRKHAGARRRRLHPIRRPACETS